MLLCCGCGCGHVADSTVPDLFYYSLAVVKTYKIPTHKAMRTLFFLSTTFSCLSLTISIFLFYNVYSCTASVIQYFRKWEIQSDETKHVLFGNRCLVTNRMRVHVGIMPKL